ncbi:Oidioi.mRNA.OKI2018_I69.PAR.g9451.t1.cds [Oikopleura dioica]|uniref:Oidioi.mRNA.OKI2018_I69.PAR.g9451.t1.cds n=1 Tax=Oikopleura dioica TaxID=34765 RepID=A0ABN7RKL4_OIKDI|nr:Oidioi.mRNA.OKI2018_I69.PAR.g9451.t1.cds [Oikopleura dioica]
MVQNTAQSGQTIIVAGNPQPVPPPPVFSADAAQRQFQTFAMAEIFLMLMNIAFSALCVALLNSSIDYCKNYPYY